MKIKELINRLAKQDPEAKIIISCETGQTELSDDDTLSFWTPRIVVDNRGSNPFYLPNIVALYLGKEHQSDKIQAPYKED